MINLKTLDLVKIIKGCYTANEITNGKIEPTDDRAILQQERLTICNNCILNVDGSCYRDTDNMWQDEKDFTIEQLMQRKTVYDKLSHSLKFGCGCILVCKTVLLTEKCPANKW